MQLAKFSVLLVIAVLPQLLWPSTSNAQTNVEFNRVTIDNGFAGDVKGVGDIDGDGFVDLVIGGLSINLYEHPTWTKYTIAIAAQEFSTDMKLSDIDSDGDLDIVSADGPGANNVVWLENPRPGSSTHGTWSRHTVGTHGTWAHDIEVADLDLDGKQDIITRKDGYTNLFFQNTTSSWTKRDIGSTLGSGEGLGVGDIDADFDADLVYGGYWVENPGDPRNGTWVRRPIANGWPADTTGAVADLNKDGLSDVLFARLHSRGNFSWYEGPTNPRTGTWIEHIVDNNMGGHKISSGDINKDGRIDLVLGLELAELSVYLARAESPGSFTKQILSTGGTHNQQLGDVGQDGDIDIFGANYLGNPPVELWLNQTTTKLALDQWTYKLVSSSHAQTFGLAFGDLNGDSWPDILSGPYWYQSPSGDILGTWGKNSLPSGMEAILVTDVDGDNLRDVIAQKNEAALSIYWLEPSSLAVTSWNVVQIGTVPTASHSLGAQGFRTGQINIGGREEIVVSSGGGIYYFSVPSNPTSDNWPRTLINTRSSDEGFAVGDIDRDGDLDIAATTGDAKGVEWYRNPDNGTGSWSSYSIGSFNEALYPDRTEVADLDKDGRLDIIVTEENGATSDAQTYWWKAPSDPTSNNWTRSLVTSQASTNSLDVADIDLDGDNDLIVAEHKGGLKLSIFSNSGNGSFTEQIVSTGKESHLGSQTIDLDKDGDLDLVSIAYDSSQNLHLWRNNAISSGADTSPPSEPASLNATALTSSQVSLSWQESTDNFAVSSYRIERCSGSSCTNFSQIGSVSSTSHIDTGLNPSTLYRYRVRAADSSGNLSGYSNTVQVTTPLALPVSQFLVSAYNFNDGSGSVLVDQAGPNNGLVSGASWGVGKYGSSLSFDGINDSVSLGAFDIENSSAMTISAWIRSSDFAADGRILSKATDTSENGHYWMVSTTENASNTVLRFRLKTNQITTTLIASTGSLLVNTWYYVAAVYDGSTMKLYLDGQEVGNTAKAGVISTNSGVQVLIGANSLSGLNPWSGNIDDLRIYRKALSPQEIQADMNSPVLSPPANLVAPSRLRVAG